MTTHFWGDGCPQHARCEGYGTWPRVVYSADDIPRCPANGVRRVEGQWLCERHAVEREKATS